MSKGSVGEVYAKVIEEVCAISRVDFEEGGVELNSLELLKSIWQKKLSETKIGQMPWDPKPEPAQPAATRDAKPAPTLPSNGHANSPPSSHSTPGPQIKTEPQPYPAQQQGNPQASYPPPTFPSNRPMTAQERAALNLHQAYGNRAGTQIAQLQQQQQAGQSRIPMQQAIRQQQPQPFIKHEDGVTDPASLPDYKQDFKQDFKPDLKSVPIKSSQTDGAMDQYMSEAANRRAAISRHREAGDRLIKAHVRASQQELEAGGLLQPLDQHRSRTRINPVVATNSDAVSSSLVRAQGDATGDDEDADEDAINSDLDDPDELDDANQEEDAVQEVMLCTYDKVQRVKNKWKCTLKDGILHVDGTDHVFHKGQGEFEW